MQEKTEREKMLNGELYLATDAELTQMHLKARQLLYDFNRSKPVAIERQKELIYRLFGKIGNNFTVRPPFYCDYGYNIKAGKNVFMNFNCCILDVMEVTIGDNSMFGPNVQIYTATHPLEADLRNSGREFAKPITIGKNVWIACKSPNCV